MTIVKITKDNQKIISTSKDETIKICGLKSGILLQSIKSFKGQILQINILNERFATVGEDGKIRFFDIESGALITSKKPYNCKFTVAFCPSTYDLYVANDSNDSDVPILAKIHDFDFNIDIPIAFYTKHIFNIMRWVDRISLEEFEEIVMNSIPETDQSLMRFREKTYSRYFYVDNYIEILSFLLKSGLKDGLPLRMTILHYYAYLNDSKNTLKKCICY